MPRIVVLPMRSLQIALIALFLQLPACSETNSEATTDTPNGAAGEKLVPCNALMADDLPISFGTIIAVGESATGTFYAVDQVDNTYRVFSSVGVVLQRLRIRGSSSRTETDGSKSIEFSCESPQTGAISELAVSLRDTTVSMALAAADLPKANFDAVAAAGEILLPKSPEDIAALELHNLPGEVAVEYNVSTQDFRRLVIIRPRDEWTYNDFRVFFGDQSLLTERNVAEVFRAKSGQTNIRFDVDGVEAVAYFPAPEYGIGTATLTENGEVSTLTEDVDFSDLDHVSFECMSSD